MNEMISLGQYNQAGAKKWTEVALATNKYDQNAIAARQDTSSKVLRRVNESMAMLKVKIAHYADMKATRSLYISSNLGMFWRGP